MIEVLPVLFALFMTGILTKRTLITVVTAIYSIFYFILFVSMKEVPYGSVASVIPFSSLKFFSPVSSADSTASRSFV